MTEQQYTPEELAYITAENDSNVETELVGDSLDLQAVSVEIEKIAERQRQITASIKLPHPITQVWKLITNYEALADFIPNLAISRLLEHPNGGIRLEQVGSQRFLRLNFSARVILDLEENFPKKIAFRMVEGDFKEFSGSWGLEPYSLNEEMGTILYYTLKVWPKRTMPVGLIERRLAKDLQLNLLAICQRLEEMKAS